MSKKKICLVTGGVGGIGSSICKTLSDDGFIVIATCRPSARKLIKDTHDKLFSKYHVIF